MAELPDFLTVREVAEIFRISPTTAYREVQRFLDTGGREGIPVLLIGGQKRIPRQKLSFHDLRHFFASALIAAGCTVKQVQADLGHESVKVTLDVYGHLWPGDEDRVRDAIDRLGTGAAKDLRRTTA